MIDHVFHPKSSSQLPHHPRWGLRRSRVDIVDACESTTDRWRDSWVSNLHIHHATIEYRIPAPHAGRSHAGLYTVHQLTTLFIFMHITSKATFWCFCVTYRSVIGGGNVCNSQHLLSSFSFVIMSLIGMHAIRTCFQVESGYLACEKIQSHIEVINSEQIILL